MEVILLPNAFGIQGAAATHMRQFRVGVYLLHALLWCVKAIHDNILFAWSRTCEPRLAYLNVNRCYSRDGYGNIRSGTRRSQGNCLRSFGHFQNSIKFSFDCDLVFELAGLNTVRSSRYILCRCSEFQCAGEAIETSRRMT